MPLTGVCVSVCERRDEGSMVLLPVEWKEIGRGVLSLSVAQRVGGRVVAGLQ